MLQASQQVHEALQRALTDRGNELARTQAALQKLQADAQASQTSGRAQVEKLQQQLHVAEASRAEALEQIKQLTGTLASTTQEHQVLLPYCLQVPTERFP